MASESFRRKQAWLQTGCNGFEKSRPTSQPISFWTEQNILSYLKLTGIPYASMYGEIVEGKNGLSLSGIKRSGCCFCPSGCHLDKGKNRFQMLTETHPKLYNYCINSLGLKEVLDYVGVKY
jgi:3'-phosphoadenosine 5'-phosphosulfate sulfotransferase (PAPS reductase)/FAD synthetase